MTTERKEPLVLLKYGTLTPTDIAIRAREKIEKYEKTYQERHKDSVNTRSLSPNAAAISVIAEEGQRLLKEVITLSGTKLIIKPGAKSLEDFNEGVGGVMLKVITDSLGQAMVGGWKDETAIKNFNDAFNGILESPMGKSAVEQTGDLKKVETRDTEVIRQELSTEKGKNFLGFFEDRGKMPRVLNGFLTANRDWEITVMNAVAVYRESLKYLVPVKT